MTTVIEKILKNNQLSVTESRRKILDVFLSSPGALLHSDIEKKAGEKFDRVTIYRTLQAFLDKGIIHSIPSADNTVHYALCSESCYGGHHQDNHVHFFCRRCGVTTCLESVEIPALNLPDGFLAEQMELVVNGVCDRCL